jgi:hypothetical protein
VALREFTFICARVKEQERDARIDELIAHMIQPPQLTGTRSN